MIRPPSASLHKKQESATAPQRQFLFFKGKGHVVFNLFTFSLIDRGDQQKDMSNYIHVFL
jgi:hypothetical protein